MLKSTAVDLGSFLRQVGSRFCTSATRRSIHWCITCRPTTARPVLATAVLLAVFLPVFVLCDRQTSTDGRTDMTRNASYKKDGRIINYSRMQGFWANGAIDRDLKLKVLSAYVRKAYRRNSSSKVLANKSTALALTSTAVLRDFGRSL